MTRNDPDPGPGPDLAARTPDRGVGRDRGAEPDLDSGREVDPDPIIGVAALVLAAGPIPEVVLARVSGLIRGPIREVELGPEISRRAKKSPGVRTNRRVCLVRDPKAKLETSRQKT